MKFKHFLNENDLKASSYCFKNGTMTPEVFSKAYGFDYTQYPKSFKVKKGKVVVTDEFVKKCNLDLFESVSVEEVKETLPEVRVNFEGKVHKGFMRTGDTTYAYVHLKSLPGTKFQYDWEQIVDAINSDSVLEAS